MSSGTFEVHLGTGQSVPDLEQGKMTRRPFYTTCVRIVCQKPLAKKHKQKKLTQTSMEPCSKYLPMRPSCRPYLVCGSDQSQPKSRPQRTVRAWRALSSSSSSWLRVRASKVKLADHRDGYSCGKANEQKQARDGKRAMIPAPVASRMPMVVVVVEYQGTRESSLNTAGSSNQWTTGLAS